VAEVLLVDTYSLFFRAFHALPPMNTSAGLPTSALYGFSVVLLQALRVERPKGVAFALDAPKATFRHELYADYKGQREALPSDLGAQFGPLRRLLAAFEVPAFEAPGFEADDILASLAASFRREAVPALVLSGDRDLLQLAHGSVKVSFLGARGQQPVVYDRERVLERFAVSPEQMPARAALVGDPSDNLPGIPGVGPRTAAKWVQKFGNVEALLANVDTLTPRRLAEVLITHADQLRRDELLATLRVDVPLGPGPYAAPVTKAALARLRALFLELEFKSLIGRVDALVGSGPD
jgi:DNA polymerase-1